MKFTAPLILVLLFLTGCSSHNNRAGTVVSISNDKFLINKELTYKGRSWNNLPVEGLLMNSRMVQGIFDDENPETSGLWKYPDTRKWDPDRNTDEFVKNMVEWHEHGLLSFTINLQGGSPQGYSNGQPWLNSAINPDGTLKQGYMNRLDKILKKADELGMVPIIGIFYFGQDEHIRDDEAVKKAVSNTIDWLFERSYRNILIEIANECDLNYDHAILQPARIHELINLVKSKEKNGYRYLVGTSFTGGTIPGKNVIESADFILLHANGVGDPAGISNMVKLTRESEGYSPKPIIFNEDDHFDFDKPVNNFTEAVRSYASWGFFDYRMKDEAFENGYQSVPVNWGISSPRKEAFFNLLKDITGGFGKKSD
ncbi:MAG TPA: hypothetical protein VHO68_13730 [Bacteroidales bacterium]|nr:hypothetical protein [Bacteroidales bacterium]